MSNANINGKHDLQITVLNVFSSYVESCYSSSPSPNHTLYTCKVCNRCVEYDVLLGSPVL